MTDSRSAARLARGGPGVNRLLSASEAARAMIRQMIESGELRPGERVNPDELGDLLGVSRTPVRDALHQLRSEGLVEILPRKGVFVRSVSPQEVNEVYALKTAIEPIAAGWAAERGSSDEKQELGGLLERLLEVGTAGEVREAAEIVDEIHGLLLGMAASSVLRDAYDVLHGRVRLLRQINMAQPGRLNATLQHHSEIVKFVLAGDSVRARAAMADHLQDASVSIRRVIP